RRRPYATQWGDGRRSAALATFSPSHDRVTRSIGPQNAIGVANRAHGRDYDDFLDRTRGRRLCALPRKDHSNFASQTTAPAPPSYERGAERSTCDHTHQASKGEPKADEHDQGIDTGEKEPHKHEERPPGRQ